MISFLYIILALMGLTLLVFLHELGHYLMGRRVGMRVEVFSIGLGTPIYTWQWNGVRWQICWFLIGGYVRFAGTTKVDDIEPYDIPDGFFGKRPWARIKVAFMGPLINLVFAFFLFFIIWSLGGREKPFADITRLIGWVDPQSELYSEGLRPGDEVVSYDGRDISSFKDHYFASVFDDGENVEVKGFQIDYQTNYEKPFEATINYYAHEDMLEDLLATGVMAPATYLIFQESTEGSPIAQSGILPGDRIVWVDGHLIFSNMQLSQMLNDTRALLTIQRGGETLFKRAPRIQLSELRILPEQKAEIVDWQFELGMEERLGKLYYIPYDLSFDRTVESTLSFIDIEKEDMFFPDQPFSEEEGALMVGDKIIAVDGVKVDSCYDLLHQLQQRQVNIMVESDFNTQGSIDAGFFNLVNWRDFKVLVNGIGDSSSTKTAGNLRLLNPITPKRWVDHDLSPERRAWLLAELQEDMKKIEEVNNPDLKEKWLRDFKKQQERLVLGAFLSDRKVNYNITPWQMSYDLVKEMGWSFKSLVLGNVSPKWMSGPVAVVQVMQYGWSVGFLEAIFWMGVISFALGVFNLLPIPMLDGGHILLAFIEMITKKPLKYRTLERLVLPFLILLAALFILVTYYDLSRIFNKLF
jgi:regulator of sigma E protease